LIENLDVKTGDKLVAPIDGEPTNHRDWQYLANMRGQEWQVEKNAADGITLKHADGRTMVVPPDYMTTKTFVPLEQTK
jgi:hypothetical protein